MHLIQIASVCVDANGHASMPIIHIWPVYRYVRWMHRYILKQFLKEIEFLNIWIDAGVICVDAY
jgi:hypothetical protein